jgi:hypothetical protein
MAKVVEVPAHDLVVRATWRGDPRRDRLEFMRIPKPPQDIALA